MSKEEKCGALLTMERVKISLEVAKFVEIWGMVFRKINRIMA